MPISDRWPDDPATLYALATVDGRRPDGSLAGELEIAACRRHLEDLETGPDRGLRWEVDRALHAINFYPSVLTITEGSHVGRPFKLLPWHQFVAGSLFGWRKTSGRMRFRSAWLETGKGQAKSPFMAATGLYMTGFYGIARARAFSIGQDKATANVLFKDAVAMCRAPFPVEDGEDVDEADTLVASGNVLIRGEGDNAWKIEFPAEGSLFQSLANGESPSGPKPTLVAADEIHEFKNNTSLEIWKNAIAKMPGDALMLLGTNTPASNQIVGTEYSEYYQKVVKGEIEDDEAFAFIARVDEADREDVFNRPEVWTKSLPALGITFPLENVQGIVNTAKHLLSTALSAKRLYMGIPLGSTGFWIAEEAWQAVQGSVDEQKLKGRRCWLSLDLSKKNDLTALSVCWIDEHGHLWVKTFYWTTLSGLKDRSRKDQTPYDQWAEKKLITAVPGAVIDKSFVAAEVRRICAEHEVEFMAFDPAGMADFIAACEEIRFEVWKYEGPDKAEGIGLKLVNHAQGPRVRFEDRQLTMPRSIERLEDRILNKTVTIDASPVSYSCAGNAMMIADGQENRAFDKKHSRGRIDGMVTIAMAVGAADNELGGEPIDLDSFFSNPLRVGA
ncbi:terminase TerL endonuclease subunit [Mesorhizobium sp. BE184]|uniref:terminase large subunit n=1 Tax=Mesorhizobium sp. BE184 TaxID=2817714 RepID=UPI00285F530B|nr:terminase TerL endonuclease subunit [Mesorhizobium sp. BE184]MDR7034504.1 phage terminase large subunit-like protein [Mesorhizobium sp. BE184]